MSVIISKFRNFYDLLRYGKEGQKGGGYGTLYGVYLPGVLTMFGVIIYLRLGWVTGSLGFWPTALIITLSCLIVFITTLSIASAATNMKIEGGGTYYMISRSLGIEIGSAVGVPLFLAQAMSISFCAMGFAESVSSFFPDFPLNYIGIAALCAMMLLNFSTGIALNTQFLIFLIIAASFASLFLGKAIEGAESLPSFSETMTISFWTGFAIFFPAATGVEAGVSMSGDLHSPKKSLPIGTIAVLLTGFIAYLSISYFFSTHAPRSVLISDQLIAQHIAKFPALITAGIWAATLSSVLGGLLAAPRTLQALARDEVFPKFFAREFGKSKEPRTASLICFVLAFTGIYYGSINQIAPVLTMFYLIAYAMLNLATGLEELLSNPSWRPTFRVPWFISISGFILCIMAMFMIDSGATFIALSFVIAIYLYMRRRGIAKKWEDIRHGILMFLSRFAIYRLSGKENPLRSWRPNFLVFSGNPMKFSNMINLTSAITKDKGFLTLISVFPPTLADQERADRWKKMTNQFLNEKKIEALVEFSIDETFFNGAKNFLKTYGIGSITPNTIVMGEMQNRETLRDSLQIIKLASETQKNIVILREEQELHPNTKKIDIWWDDDSRKNSELMILLAHMLASNKEWKGAIIRLKSIVLEENGRAQRLAYFRDFLSKSRLTAESEIYVGPKGSDSLYNLASRFSTDADIVFFGLKAMGVNESLEEFEDYYLKTQNLTKTLQHVAFVTNSDPSDLTDIFK